MRNTTRNYILLWILTALFVGTEYDAMSTASSSDIIEKSLNHRRLKTLISNSPNKISGHRPYPQYPFGGAAIQRRRLTASSTNLLIPPRIRKSIRTRSNNNKRTKVRVFPTYVPTEVPTSTSAVSSSPKAELVSIAVSNETKVLVSESIEKDDEQNEIQNLTRIMSALSQEESEASISAEKPITKREKDEDEYKKEVKNPYLRNHQVSFLPTNSPVFKLKAKESKFLPTIKSSQERFTKIVDPLAREEVEDTSNEIDYSMAIDMLESNENQSSNNKNENIFEKTSIETFTDSSFFITPLVETVRNENQFMEDSNTTIASDSSNNEKERKELTNVNQTNNTVFFDDNHNTNNKSISSNEIVLEERGVGNVIREIDTSQLLSVDKNANKISQDNVLLRDDDAPIKTVSSSRRTILDPMVEANETIESKLGVKASGENLRDVEVLEHLEAKVSPLREAVRDQSDDLESSEMDSERKEVKNEVANKIEKRSNMIEQIVDDQVLREDDSGIQVGIHLPESNTKNRTIYIRYTILTHDDTNTFEWPDKDGEYEEVIIDNFTDDKNSTIEVVSLGGLDNGQLYLVCVRIENVQGVIQEQCKKMKHNIESGHNNTKDGKNHPNVSLERLRQASDDLGEDIQNDENVIEESRKGKIKAIEKQYDEARHEELPSDEDIETAFISTTQITITESTRTNILEETNIKKHEVMPVQGIHDHNNQKATTTPPPVKVITDEIEGDGTIHDKIFSQQPRDVNDGGFKKEEGAKERVSKVEKSAVRIDNSDKEDENDGMASYLIAIIIAIFIGIVFSIAYLLYFIAKQKLRQQKMAKEIEERVAKKAAEEKDREEMERARAKSNYIDPDEPYEERCIM